MTKHFILTIVFLINASFGLAQADLNSAPIDWVPYRAADQGLSVSLPKLPVRFTTEDPCSQLRIDRYLVYSLDVVYGINVYARIEQPPPDRCGQTKRFDADSFQQRAGEVKDTIAAAAAKDVLVNKRRALYLKGELYKYWLFNDFQDSKRWIELFVVNGPEDQKSVVNFVNSLKIDTNAAGIEIGSGAKWMIGDRPSADETREMADREQADDSSERVRFIYKPVPRYTDTARINNIEGEAELRVTFLANGTIGGISPVKGLPHGLTEQAIAAARKLVFLPARRKGQRFSSTMIVNYRFSIY